MCARAKVAGQVLCGQHGADWRPSGKGLGQRHDVWNNILLLISPEAAGPATADLDFIVDQQ